MELNGNLQRGEIHIVLSKTKTFHGRSMRLLLGLSKGNARVEISASFFFFFFFLFSFSHSLQFFN